MTRKQGEAVSHNKPCTLCGTERSVLVRCQIDETGQWHLICPGKCWKQVSGGEIDAKGHEAEHPHYRYGGMWKNRHADGPLNAKKPKKNKRARSSAAREEQTGPSNPAQRASGEDQHTGNEDSASVEDER